MIKFSCFGKNIQCLYTSSCVKLACLSRSTCYLMLCLFRFLLLTVTPFWFQLCYFLFLSFLGFWFLKVLKPRTDSFRPRNIDLFFTSVSATTVSSMSTVEMEVFSNSQLMIITILMFIGGEVFTSMVGLFLRKSKLKQLHREEEKVASISSSSWSPENAMTKIELGEMRKPDSENTESGFDHHSSHHTQQHDDFGHSEDVSVYHSIGFLGFIVLAYLLVVNGLGVALVSIYLSFVSSARNVLRSKGLKLFTFSVFTTVSTFASCGFVPTNENMMVFSKNSGLLLILIPQVLLGNTLFPSCLRFSIWVLGKLFQKFEKKSNYLLKNSNDIGYLHLLPSRNSINLVLTVLGFILVQLLMFCFMEWYSQDLRGLNSLQKIIGLSFQSVNTRHTGETIMNLSKITPAILVLLVVMMYLPPYTSFLWIKRDEQHPEILCGRRKRRGKIAENLIFSQLSYLVIFIILICISERKKMKEDPLNFNVLNIVVEVISAYGNVGYTMGYSCELQIKADDRCLDKLYGFAGKWSDGGKIILIAVMVFGRLKKFNMHGGRAWKLL